MHSIILSFGSLRARARWAMLLVGSLIVTVSYFTTIAATASPSAHNEDTGPIGVVSVLRRQGLPSGRTSQLVSYASSSGRCIDVVVLGSDGRSLGSVGTCGGNATDERLSRALPKSVSRSTSTTLFSGEVAVGPSGFERLPIAAGIVTCRTCSMRVEFVESGQTVVAPIVDGLFMAVGGVRNGSAATSRVTDDSGLSDAPTVRYELLDPSGRPVQVHET